MTPIKVCPQCGTEYPANARFCELDGTALRSAGAEPDLVGSIIADRYHILKKLGEGGMGQVYLVEHVKMGRKSALKVMHPGMVKDVDAVSRFNREAANASRISHPNVAAVNDFGETEDGIIFLAMEYVDGPSLTKIIEEAGALPAKRAAEITRQAAAGLAVAHDMGIVHRDLKPDNIMIARMRDGGDLVKVVDFGIAKAAGSAAQKVTQAGLVIGTPEYMSPEQLAGESLDGRSDIYSLALVAFNMLTGTLPFPSDSAQEAMIMRLTTAPQSLRAARPGVAWPDALEAVMAKALERDIRLRYQTADDFAGDFLAAIESEPRPSAAGAASATGQSMPAPAMIIEPEQTMVPLTNRRNVFVYGAAGGLLLLLILVIGQSLGFPNTPGRGGLVVFGAIVITAAIGLIAYKGLPRLSSGPSTTDTPPSLPVEPPAAPIARPSRPANQDSTQVVGAWRPSGETRRGNEPKKDSGATQVFAAPGEASALKGFPVAISIVASAHPAQIGLRVACNAFPFSIGRAPTCNVCIEHDETLSRTHAQIDVDDSGFVVRDMSVNGLYVDGRHLHGASETLRFGATIELSPVTALKFIADVPMLPDLTGQLLNERYRLSRRLHNSLKAATYIATDERLPRSLAVKVFSPSLSKLASYQTEFRRQAEMAVKLQHARVCTVIDWGEADVPIGGKLERANFLCTEYLAGGSLTSKLELPEPPSATTCVDWIEAISSGLDHAHRSGIVHGDLRPGCILFDATGAPCLSDFALATERARGSRAVIGSPDFLAPEQWHGEAASALSDQYSLAVLSYVMLTGARPLEGQGDPAVRTRNFERGATPAHLEAQRRGRSDVSESMADVLARAMSTQPQDRYESVAAFSEALSRAFRSPQPKARKPRVFFSYHRATTSAWATHFSSTLRAAHGYSVFVDTQASDGTSQITDFLKEEIHGCDVFVCLLGPETLKSSWVMQEIRNAAKCGKPMVPVFQEGFKPAEVNTRNNPGLRRLLDSPGVHLFDRHNVHVDHTIDDLAERISKLLTSPRE